MDSETIRRVAEPSTEQDSRDESNIPTWWSRYRASLEASGLSNSAIEVIDLDSTYLLDHGICPFGSSSGADHRWPVSRIRRGLAVGSVQSGKTASLLAAVAKSLDRGVNVVVILAGTRVALWRQTYERMISQLDGWSPITDAERRKRRVLLPSPNVILPSPVVPELDFLYFETPNMVRRMLSTGRPLIAVVMKNTDHLMRFGKYLHDLLASALERSDSPLHMLVIDDEADDGSILDKEIEANLAPDSDGLKQIPRHIARLWSGQGAPYETFHKALYATYLAYTATPQANLLQSDHNPLSPSEFVTALRFPFDEGTVSPPRRPSFSEPRGLAAFYTGGEMFYRRIGMGEGALCVTRKFPERNEFSSNEDFEAAVAQERAELLSEALRAYFVSGAIRLLQSKQSLARCRSASPGSEGDVRSVTPSAHTMLFHPSARIDSHFWAAQEIVEWSAEYARESPTGQELAQTLELNVEGLRARLTLEENKWRRWVIAFEKTRERLSFLPGGGVYPKVDEDQWDDIRQTLIDEVFPYTRLAVINSDPRADDRPQFQPEPNGDGRFRAPRDIYTIFVSGNVMARGITLDGLTTTLFLRSANEPLADTQMQMQRWFGYRGSHLCWCRVFLFDDQHRLFTSYHEGDEALRREIFTEMNARPESALSPLVLQGVEFRATGKIANLRSLPLCPGADPFVRVIETGEFAEHNASVLANLLAKEKWSDVVVGSTVRGKAMQRRLSLIEVADVLESFRYTEHDPNPTSSNHDRWRALASENGLEPPIAPLFRPPRLRQTSMEAVSPASCPYSIAAYLRLWSALLSRRARGLYPTDDRRTPWSMIDLNQYARSAPRFVVGVRYGAAGGCSDARLSAHGILRMERSSSRGVLSSTWGSRNPGERSDAYLGDQLFDYHVHLETPPRQIPGEPLWRKPGSPGLLLFHVIRALDGAPDAVTVGLALPLGGPDHIAALRSGPGARS